MQIHGQQRASRQASFNGTGIAIIEYTADRLSFSSRKEDYTLDS